MSSNGYIAAFDVGDRRIGVAIASSIAKIPSPYTTIDRLKQEDIHAWVKDFIKDNSVITLVVGMPRDIRGIETEQTSKTKDFIRSIEAEIAIPIITQDEAVTSVDAENRLKALGKPYSKSDIDSEAACIILQDYLSSQYERLA